MSSTPPASTHAGEPTGRFGRRLGIALVAAAVLLACLRVALPYALPPLAGWLALREAGLEARIRNVDLEIFRGGLVIEGLWVGPPGRAPQDGTPPDPSAALLAWERGALSLAWRDLIRGRLRLSDVQLDTPRVRLGRRADGLIDPLAGATPPPRDSAERTEPAAPADEAGGEGSGWPLRVERMRLSGAVLRIVEEEDGAELVDLALGELELAGLSVDGSAIGLAGIGLRGPRLRVERDFLFDPTAQERRPPEPPEQAEPAAGSAAPAPAAPPPVRGYRLDDLDIGRAAFEVVMGEQVLALALTLKADDITLDADDPFPFEVTIEAEEGGRLVVSGEAELSPPSLVGKVRLEDMPLRLVSGVVRPDLVEWVRSLTAHAELDVDFHSAARGATPPGLKLSGRAALSALDAADPRGPDLALGWQQLEVRLSQLTVPIGGAAETTPTRVDVERLTLVGPKARYRRPSDALARLLHGPTGVSEADDAEEPGGPAPEIHLALVEVKDGELVFHDGQADPAYDAHVTKLSGVGQGVAPTAPSADHVTLDFMLNERASVEAAGSIGASDSELRVEVRRLSLPPAKSYTRAAGITVARGALSLASDVKVRGTRWTLDNHVTLHHVRLDAGGSKQFIEKLNMPIGLILAVLRDSKGDIQLPVRFEIDQGKTRAGVVEIVVGALRQALVGAASIPLKTIGGVLAAGRARYDPVPAAPGSVAMVGDEERGRSLLALLSERPMLALILTGRAGKKDRPFLAIAELAERFAAGAELPPLEPELDPSARQRIQSAVEARAAGSSGELSPEDEASLQRYLEAIEVPDERYESLARARAAAVRDWLVNADGIDPARIETSDSTERGAPGVVLDFDSIAPAGDTLPGS